MQIFNPESKFSQFIYSVTDYVKLGLVFLLFSIPGFTAGAAAAAVMTVGMRIERNEAPTVFRPFREAFRANFRQGTGLTALFMLVFGFLAADWYILAQMEVTGLIRVITAILFLMTLLGGGLMLWAFPTLARFELKNRQIIHNSMIHMLARFPQTLLALGAAAGGFAGAALVPEILPLITMFVPAFVIWYMSRVCVKRFSVFDGTAAPPERAEEPVSETDYSRTEAAVRNIPALN